MDKGVSMFRAYLDNNANTPVAPEVLEAMQPALQGLLGNASSIHQRGQAAKAAMEQARADVAALVGARPSEIVFTSGGTESDNLAIRGFVAEWQLRHPGAGPAHLISTRIEHHAVLNVFEDLERLGHPVTYLPVGATGALDPAAVVAALRPDTALLSVMLANNETGVLQPVEAIGEVARAAKVAFHVDAIQGVGRVPVDVERIGCQLLSLSGHKIHAPSGVGALFVRRGTRLQPLLLGGHHERDRRAGSENMPGILGLGAAAGMALRDGEAAAARMRRLRDRFEAGVVAAVAETEVVGGGVARVANTSNLCFKGVEGEALVIALDLEGICASTGAACSSGAIEPSHVLMAMGYSRAQARSCVRFSLGRQNTDADIDAVLEALPRLVGRQRQLSAGLLAQSA
jgi:cysteine desulfurase